VRFATCAVEPFTFTRACSSLTVPTTRSLMMPATEIALSAVTNLSGGDVMVTCGGVVSKVAVMLAVPTAPSGDVAVAVMMFGPSARGSAIVKAPFAVPAGTELIETIAVGSSTLPLTVVGLMFR
jgi:hypothetical protein